MVAFSARRSVWRDMWVMTSSILGMSLSLSLSLSAAPPVFSMPLKMVSIFSMADVAVTAPLWTMEFTCWLALALSVTFFSTSSASSAMDLTVVEAAAIWFACSWAPSYMLDVPEMTSLEVSCPLLTTALKTAWDSVRFVTASFMCSTRPRRLPLMRSIASSSSVVSSLKSFLPLFSVLELESSPLLILMAVSLRRLNCLVKPLVNTEPSTRPMSMAVRKLRGWRTHSTTPVMSTRSGTKATAATTAMKPNMNLYPTGTFASITPPPTDCRTAYWRIF